jgi:multidrug efflux pump subunit AcrB
MSRVHNEFTWKITSSFFSFWIKRWRFTFLLTALLVFLWTNAMISIPKESSPEIEFGIVSITTVYPGTNPIDIDSLITQPIENEIDNIVWIKKITATSNIWVSSILVELETSADTQSLLLEIKDAIDKVQLPTDASDPRVTELATSNELLFEVVLYGDRMTYSSDALMKKANRLQRLLEQSPGIATVNYGWMRMWWRTTQRTIAEYDIVLRLDQTMMEQIGLTIQQIAQIIRTTNMNQPLWRYEIDSKGYDIRIENKYGDIDDLLNTVLVFSDWAQLLLRDIASYEFVFKDKAIRSFGLKEQIGNNAVMLTINKKPWENIFSASKNAKEAIESLMGLSEFIWLNYAITNDLSDIIIEDYKNLGNAGWQTLLIVFLCVIFFVWRKEAAIATFSLPLSFFITFLVLQYLGLSLNFLTNFSLVLTLGIIIDIAVVLIEAWSERLKLWFSSQTAMLMAIRDFAAPLLSWTATTIVVFIPLLTLPWLIGKFLAYIPITVFATLVAALLIGMTVTPAIFVQLFKGTKTYTPDEQTENFLTTKDKEILALERVWKTLRPTIERTWREKTIHAMGDWYAKTLRRFITSPKLRVLSIAMPIVALIVTLVVLSPRIGFTLFPAWDNNTFTITATYPVGTITQTTAQAIPLIENIVSTIEELKHYTIQGEQNKITINIQLIEKAIRNKAWLRNVFEVEDYLVEQLGFLIPQGVSIDSAVQAWWPPQWKPVGIKLIAEQNTQFLGLLEVAKDFEVFIRSLQWVRNVWRSSADVPGQFIYKINNEYLHYRGLSVWEMAQAINISINWFDAWTIAMDGEDIAIRLQLDQFVDWASPQSLEQLLLPTRVWPIKVGDMMTYSLDSAVWAIARENTNITITVDADVDDAFRNQASEIQQKLQDFAEWYSFPQGLRFEVAGEWAENAELISATALWFLVAILMIFAILVLEFNSYAQPTIILYSVIMWMIWVNIWLYLTWTPYSMSFAIWLIAMTWIVVDNAVVLIERANENIKHAVDYFEAIIEAWRSRLAPIMLTSLTDTLWLVPIAFQDPFWQWLSFTIGFGLITWSIMTLFVVPSIYYMILMKKKKQDSLQMQTKELVE